MGEWRSPYTRNHWETDRVARRFPLARGWERQLDARVNALFYREHERVDPAAYRAWLARLAVEYVAVPRARLDYTGIPEARLVRGGLPYLRPVWGNRDWRVYRFLPAPASTSITLKPDAFVVTATKPGPIDVPVRYTPYWTATSPGACVEPGPAGLTRVRAARRGRIRVVARLAPWRWFTGSPTCESPEQPVKMTRLPMLARLRRLEARLLPHGVLDVLRQVALFAAAYWGYRFVRGQVDGKAAERSRTRAS